MWRGDRLKRLREKKGYTHQELSQLLDVGYAQINRWEANRATPDADDLFRMSELFSVSIEYLLGMVDDPTPHFRVDNLTNKEIQVLNALRRGEKVEAIKAIVNDE